MMKRTLIFFTTAILFLSGCSAKQKDAQTIENPDGSVSITRIDEDGKAILFNKKYNGATNVTQVNLAQTSRANPVIVDLSAYEGKDIDIQFSCEMLVEDKTTENQ